MSKITLSYITSGYGSTTQLNNNFAAISTAFSNTISRDGSTPNSMSADLDLNGYSLLNVGSLDVSDISFDGSTLQQAVLDAASYTLESEHWASYPHAVLVPEGNGVDEYSSYSYAQDSLTYSIASAASAAAALTSENACAAYSSLGLGAAVAFDFGLVADSIIVFPTDFGLIV